MDQSWIALARRVLVERSTVREIPMYDQSRISELIRFARIDAGSTVIDVYLGDGDWTRLFFRSRGTGWTGLQLRAV